MDFTDNKAQNKDRCLVRLHRILERLQNKSVKTVYLVGHTGHGMSSTVDTEITALDPQLENVSWRTPAC